jgi:hypothetical protein
MSRKSQDACRHEHLYKDLDTKVIRSDDFPADGNPVGLSRMFLDCRVVLCTLSMLSVDKVVHVARIIPVQTVIVDEASQIELGDYLPALHLYSRSLRKLVFIGDDKQRMKFLPCLNLKKRCL